MIELALSDFKHRTGMNKLKFQGEMFIQNHKEYPMLQVPKEGICFLAR